jgi:hypothetical protein
MPDYPFGEGKSLPYNKAKSAAAGAISAGIGNGNGNEKKLMKKGIKKGEKGLQEKSTKQGMHRKIMTDMKTGKSDTTYFTPTPITLEEFYK